MGQGIKQIRLSVEDREKLEALVGRPTEGTALSDGHGYRCARVARRATYDYERHGVVDQYAALEIATGNVTHRVIDSHTGADFLAVRLDQTCRSHHQVTLVNAERISTALH